MTTEDLERLRRSAAMAPLPQDKVTELLDEHRELLVERAELDALRARLGPAWVEQRDVLNEMVALTSVTPEVHDRS
jgi:hypothetical protein